MEMCVEQCLTEDWFQADVAYGTRTPRNPLLIRAGHINTLLFIEADSESHAAALSDMAQSQDWTLDSVCFLCSPLICHDYPTSYTFPTIPEFLFLLLYTLLTLQVLDSTPSGPPPYLLALSSPCSSSCVSVLHKQLRLPEWLFILTLTSPVSFSSPILLPLATSHILISPIFHPWEMTLWHKGSGGD